MVNDCTTPTPWLTRIAPGWCDVSAWSAIVRHIQAPCNLRATFVKKYFQVALRIDKQLIAD
jgi:hypothetical protein